MNQNDDKRAAKPASRWMLVLLLLIAIGAGGVIAYFKFFPETVVGPPTAPKEPMHNAPK